MLEKGVEENCWERMPEIVGVSYARPAAEPPCSINSGSIKRIIENLGEFTNSYIISNYALLVYL